MSHNQELLTKGDIFDAINDPGEAFINFISEFLKDSNLALEAGCGTGRIMIPLAQKGFSLVGFDFSNQMLERFKEKIKFYGVEDKIEIFQGSFQEFSCDKKFDVIYFSTDTFTMVESIVERHEIIKNLSKYLNVGGRLIMPFNNPVKYLNGERIHFIERKGQIKGVNVVVSEEREINSLLGLRIGHKTESIYNSQGINIEKEKSVRPLAIVTKNEIKVGFEAAGLEIENEYGSFNFDPLTHDSEKAIYIGIKNDIISLRKGEIYDALNPLPDDYKSFVLSFINNGLHVLELGCGTGRLSIPIIEAGAYLVGIDYNEQMLKVAHKKVKKSTAGDSARLFKMNFAEFNLNEEYDFAFFSSNTLTFLLDVKERLNAFKCAYKHLKNKGRLLVILDNPCVYLKNGYTRILERIAVLNNEDMLSVIEERSLDMINFLRKGSDTTMIKSTESKYVENKDVSHAIITRDEICILAYLSGFNIIKEYGDYNFQPLTLDSPKAIYLLEK